MKVKQFEKLDYETRKKLVSEWAVSTMDEETVRKRLARFIAMGYDRESFLFHQQELAYMKAVHNSQNVNSHIPK